MHEILRASGAVAWFQRPIGAEGSDGRAAGRTASSLAAMIAGCIMLQAALIFLQPINWDEFRFLSDVHLLRRGELATSVQTFHAHLFPWLSAFGSEIEQIIAARVAMLALEAGTIWMIYLCARRFVSVEAALFAALCYVSTGFVMRHGASFRFDPPSTFLMMAALTVLTTRRIGFASSACVGVLTALAAMITIKSIFFVPTLAAVAWWRCREAPALLPSAARLAFGLVAGIVTLVSLYLFHDAHVTATTLGHSGEVVSSSARKTLGHAQILPQGDALLRTLIRSPLNWLMIVGGIVASAGAVVRARGPDERNRAFALAAFGLPLLTLLFYRNSFPYYYAFLLAPVAVLAAPAAERALAGRRMALVGMVMTCTGAVHGVTAISPVLQAQRATLGAVHAMFPEPVAYIDRCSMIASFAKQGFFMSTWGTEVYRDAGRPIMRETLLRTRPAFLLVNGPGLADAMAGVDHGTGLLPEDAAILRDNFIPHWGAIRVAGKKLAVTPQGTTFEMLIAGRYTIESAVPVTVDGALRRPGEVVTLAAGRHVARVTAGRATVTLRWGDHFKRPSAPPPKLPLFARF